MLTFMPSMPAHEWFQGLLLIVRILDDSSTAPAAAAIALDAPADASKIGLPIATPATPTTKALALHECLVTIMLVFKEEECWFPILG
jgi:hypothetical protein